MKKTVFVKNSADISGMRSFPGKDDDDITHEILIATDGCQTSSGYYLQKGLKIIRKRGIKVRQK